MTLHDAASLCQRSAAPCTSCLVEVLYKGCRCGYNGVQYREDTRELTLEKPVARLGHQNVRPRLLAQRGCLSPRIPRLWPRGVSMSRPNQFVATCTGCAHRHCIRLPLGPSRRDAARMRHDCAVPMLFPCVHNAVRRNG